MDDDRRAKLERLRARTAIDPLPARLSEGVRPASDVHAGARRPRGRRGDRRGLPRGRAGWPPGAATAGRRSSTSSTARAGSRCTRGRTCSATSPSSACCPSTSATSIGVDGTAFKSRRGELTLRATDWALLAKSLRAAAGEVPRARGRRDPLPPPRARPDRQRGGARAVHPALAGGRRDPPLARRARLPRGRDAGAPAALRRRAGAALHHPPQRARPRPLPADRHRALPQAADRRRARARLRAGQGLPQRGRSRPSTTPSSRCSSGTRPTPTTATSPPSSRSWWRSWPSEVGYDGRDRLLAAVAAGDPARRDPRDDRHRRAGRRDRDALLAAAGDKDIELDPDGDLAQAGGRPALQARRARAHGARPSSSTTRWSCRRSPRTTAPSRAWSSASSASPAAWSSPTPSPSSTTPTSSARASRSSAPADRRGRRRGPALRRGLRARARAGHAADRRHRRGHRPARDAPVRTTLDPRGRAVPGHARPLERPPVPAAIPLAAAFQAALSPAGRPRGVVRLVGSRKRSGVHPEGVGAE